MLLTLAIKYKWLNYEILPTSNEYGKNLIII